MDKYKVEESKKGVFTGREVTPWNGEEYGKTRDIKLESGRKIVGR